MPMQRGLIVANPVFPPIRSEPLIDPRTGEITIRYAEYFEQVSTTIFENESDIVDRLDAIDAELDAIDNEIDAIDIRIDAIDLRIDAIDIRLDDQEARLNGHDVELENAFQLISENNT